MHYTIIENYITLLKAGAFGYHEKTSIHAMSNHKWRKMVQLAEEQHVLSFLSDGAKIVHRKDGCVPEILRSALINKKILFDEVTFDSHKAHMFNSWGQHRWEEVREEELNSGNISDETLELLDIIIMNSDYFITASINIEGVMILGRYIRNNKEYIDYSKLNYWLHRIGMVQLANILANILVLCLDFQSEEVPFYVKPYKNSQKLFLDSLQTTPGNQRIPIITRLNVAMLETLSFRFGNAISAVKDIEE